MKKMQKNTNGITLIALIITIIILLILAGISISALTQTGLFSRAKQAEQLSKEKQEEENATLGTYENEIGKYLGENSEETPSEPKEIKLVDKINDGTIKIGDYVKYTPDVVTNTDKSYTDLISNLGTYSGSADNTTSTLAQEMNLNWRVLDVKDGQVRLISDGPTTSKITLNGYNGYNNAVKLLDDTCNTLYNNQKVASEVQNLKIEDIQDKMIEKDYTKMISEYGKKYSPTTKYYPSILLKEKEQTVNGAVGTELELSEQKEFINQTTNLSVNSWTVKYTLWVKTMNKSDLIKDIYYKLFINNGNNYSTYWMSSRCVDVDSGGARFRIRFVDSGKVSADYLCYSDNGEISKNYAFRPVVTLNADVQIDTVNSGNGSTAELAYVIK